MQRASSSMELDIDIMTSIGMVVNIKLIGASIDLSSLGFTLTLFAFTFTLSAFNIQISAKILSHF